MMINTNRPGKCWNCDCVANPRHTLTDLPEGFADIPLCGSHVCTDAAIKAVDFAYGG